MPNPDRTRSPAFSRLLRIFLSVCFSLLAANAILQLVHGSLDGHLTHLLGGPLFIISFLGPVRSLGVPLILTGILFILDRLAPADFWKRRSRSIKFVTFLFLGLATDFYSRTLGWVFLSALIYWLLTGRMAGRIGWSARKFRSTPWDEKLYVIFWVALLAPPILTTSKVLLERAVENTFPSALADQLVGFPDSQSCLKDGASAAEPVGLYEMDWTNIETTRDAEICISRILSDLGDIDEAPDWMEHQGLTFRPFSASQRYYENYDGTLRVSGSWSIRTNGPLFPTSGTIRRIFFAIPYGMSVNATYSHDGKVLQEVGISYSSL